MGVRTKPSEMNREALAARAKRRKTISINGENVNVETSPEILQIERALKKNKIATNKKISLNTKAQLLLGLLECKVCTEEKNYSLITTCDDAEAIDNENILDPASYDVRPTPIRATDKFTSDSDPFYNLDNDIPDSYSIMNSSFATRNMPDFVSFVAKIFKNNRKNGNNGYPNSNEVTGSMAATTTAATTTETTTTTATTTTY